MNSISSKEIKRRGIVAVDDALQKGPVHVIKNNQPQYVVLTEERYEELLSVEDEAYIARVRSALEDVKAGHIRKFKSVDGLLNAINQEDEL